MHAITGTKIRELNGFKAVLASLIGAAFTALCAQIVFHIPGNPVPVTMQVFAVICCGMMLGSRYGLLSQIEYVAAGIMGAPVFAGFKAGPVIFADPTFGYLIGFIAAAYIVGRLFETLSIGTFPSACLAGLVGVAIIHIFGACWLSVWLRMTPCEFPGWGAWVLGVAPFLGIDAIKAILAARLTMRKNRD